MEEYHCLYLVVCELTYKTRKDLKLETSSETNLVAIEIDKHTIGSNKAIVVVLIYRPPSTSIATLRAVMLIIN